MLSKRISMIGGYGLGIMLLLVLNMMLSISVRASETTTFEKKWYTHLMQELSSLEDTFFTNFEKKKQEIVSDYKKFSFGIQQQYPYKALQCLGVLDLDYTFSGATVQTKVFDALTQFNTANYRYKLWLDTSYTWLQKKMSHFKIQELPSFLKNLDTAYATYKQQFILDFSTYIKENKALLMPLVVKMKKIDDVRKHHKKMIDVWKKLEKKVHADPLLSKYFAMQGSFEKILAMKFDQLVRSMENGSSDSYMKKVAALKEKYLFTFKEDFKKLFVDVFGISFNSLEDVAYHTFVDKYFQNNSYVCHALLVTEADHLGSAWDFNQEYNYYLLEKNNQAKFIATLSQYFGKYLKLTDKQKKTKWMFFMFRLKQLFAHYTWLELRKLKLEL